ncbi:MAG: DOMON domain-containing protein [Candidatus Aerophobetes bacterium]
MNNLHNVKRGDSSKRNLLHSLYYVMTKTCFKAGIITIVGVVFTSLGLYTAQKIERPSQSAALAQVSSGSYHPEIDGIVEEQEYPQKLELEKGMFNISWKNDREFLYMALKAKTIGWIAIGFEPTSRMKDADMIFGWVEDGQTTLLDLYSTGSTGPHPPDLELGGTDDILEFEGSEEDGYTTIEFKRKMDTGDKYDKVLVPGQTLNFIWAMASLDSFNRKHNILNRQAKLTLQKEEVESAQAWMDIELKDVRTGELFRVSDFRGRPILLESFAVWCPTCLRQQKEMQKLKEKEGDTVVHISLNTDPNEDEDKIREHLEENGLDWYFAVSPPELTKALIDEVGLAIVSAPLAPVILICEDESVRLLRGGVKSAQTLLSEIEKGCENGN